MVDNLTKVEKRFREDVKKRAVSAHENRSRPVSDQSKKSELIDLFTERRKNDEKRIASILYGLGLSCCLFFVNTSSDAAVTLKMGSIAGPSSLEGQGAALFGKLIEQKTKGEVKVNVGYSSAFGGLGPLLQSVEMGSVDMMVSSIDQWEFIDPALRILRFAYVFRDYNHYTKYLDSPIAESL
jgi:TRAP-type C4-dicarboxylate transport system substrate-binding protein